MTACCNKSDGNEASLILPFSPVVLIKSKLGKTTTVNVKAKIATECSKGG